MIPKHICVLLYYLFSVHCIYCNARAFTRGDIICCHCLFVCPSIHSHVQQFKKTKKTKKFNFRSKTGEHCTKFFSLEELEISLSKAHDKARGPDNIYYQLLQHLLAESTLQLTKHILNLVTYHQF